MYRLKGVPAIMCGEVTYGLLGSEEFTVNGTVSPLWRLKCLAEESKRACGIPVVSLQHSANSRVTGISGDGEKSIRVWKCQCCCCSQRTFSSVKCIGRRQGQRGLEVRELLLCIGSWNDGYTSSRVNKILYGRLLISCI